MATAEEEYKKIQLSGKRPIPGQSLTNDPEKPDLYEQAPEFVSVHGASEYMFGKLIEPDVYTSIMNAVGDGTAIMDIAQTLLFVEFQEGKFNPDLMFMLVEPVAYMIIALAEKLDLPMVIYRGEEEDEEIEQQYLGVTVAEDRLKKLQKAGQTGRVPANVITPEMEQQIAELPEIETKQESLLASPEEKPAPDQQSLMSPPQGI
tara:strand:+ start:345 stop:956 length:612 start_codon:yes stop_codon:yes gene_type:complete